MSMYNVMFGQNPMSDVILAILGLTKADCGRFRDCFVSNGKIAIYTRNGGGNREDYQDVISELAKNPNYLYDKDDDFDCTYATFYFSFPKEFEEELKKIDSGIEFNPDKRWSDLLNSFNK